MCLAELKTTIEIAESIAKILAILTGGFWVYYKFIRQRDNHPLMDFTVDLVFHSKKNDYWIVEVVAYLENRGKVQHKVTKFTFELASLNSDDRVDISQDFGGQVLFPHEVSKGSFLPEKSKYFFNEPGLKNRYSFITRVPINAEVVLLHSNFSYEDGKHSHAAEVTKKVPKEETDLKSQPTSDKEIKSDRN